MPSSGSLSFLSDSRDRRHHGPGARLLCDFQTQVQFAKARGLHVTATCGTSNVARVRALGADEVVDYSTVGDDVA